MRQYCTIVSSAVTRLIVIVTFPTLPITVDSRKRFLFNRRTLQPVNIEMPLRVYDGLVDKCDQASREYVILKNALLVRRVIQQDRVAEICCSLEDADKLVVLASAIYPDAVEYIKRAIVDSLGSD